MYIYRVEDPDTGRGPYTPANMADSDKVILRDMLLDAHSDYKGKHPAMFDDCGFHEHFRFSAEAEQYIAGCKTVEDLVSWFVGFWDMLTRAGYVLRVYDIPDLLVRVGTYQVCFPIAAAKKIDEMRISDFLAVVE